MPQDTGLPILIIEDREDDHYHLEKCLRTAGIANPIFSLADGLEAIRYFTGEVPYADRVAHPLPGILFLDLLMPRLGGKEVLAWLQNHGDHPHFLTFIYSGYTHVADVHQFYAMGADSFLSKPIRQSEVRDLIEQFPGPWVFGDTLDHRLEGNDRYSNRK